MIRLITGINWRFSANTKIKNEKAAAAPDIFLTETKLCDVTFACSIRQVEQWGLLAAQRLSKRSAVDACAPVGEQVSPQNGRVWKQKPYIKSDRMSAEKL